MLYKDKLTIIVQPDWRTSRDKVAATHTFRIPGRIIFFIILCIGLLVSFGINGSKAISRNIILHNKITYLQESLDRLGGIEGKIDKIRKEERIIRAFLGIEESGKNINIHERMGLGGADPQAEITSLPLNARKELEDMPAAVPLHKQVSDLYEDVRELNVMLSKMSRKLNSTPTIMPVKGDDTWITSWFGWRKSPFTGLREFHKGLDISAKKGTPIMAAADGVVEDAGSDRFLGNYVMVRHDNRYSTFYGHLLSYKVKNHQKINRGQVIGHMGSTGISTGYHLHYEIIENQQRVNPYNFILNRSEIMLAANLAE
jgi:hypothetical protein